MSPKTNPMSLATYVNAEMKLEIHPRKLLYRVGASGQKRYGQFLMLVGYVVLLTAESPVA